MGTWGDNSTLDNSTNCKVDSAIKRGNNLKVNWKFKMGTKIYIKYTHIFLFQLIYFDLNSKRFLK